MRNARFLYAAAGLLTIGAVAASAGGRRALNVIGNVFLQDTTPGTAQVGHATISGTFRAGQVVVSNSNPAAIPIIGNQTATSGNAVGGSFSTASDDGTAVRGTATSVANSQMTGVLGVSRGTNTYSAGVKGTGRMGVYGVADQNNGYGGFFYTSKASATSLYAQASFPAVNAIQAFGNPDSGFQSVVYVNAGATSGAGVAGRFRCANSSGYALWAESLHATGATATIIAEQSSNQGTAVYGIIPTGSTGIAVYGRQVSGGTGFGVYSAGDLGCSGNKQFQIDYPYDPEHTYLNHFCTEGPAPYNTYRGNVHLNAKGEATVHLPEYFAAINTDPTYTLTAVGASMPGLFVASKVQNNTFTIGGGKPGGEVSWCVTGIRNDRYEQQYGYQAVQPKPANLQGTYVQPELYGKPAEKQQFADLTSKR